MRSAPKGSIVYREIVHNTVKQDEIFQAAAQELKADRDFMLCCCCLFVCLRRFLQSWAEILG